VTAKTRLEPYPRQTLEAVSGILGATNGGLSNKEIIEVLATAGIPDVVAEAERANPQVQKGLAYIMVSKRDRILRALETNQGKTQSGNALIAFITKAMNPQRYVQRQELFADWQQQLNEVLVFVGLRITDEGKVGKSQSASTLSEAAQVAGRLTTELTRRGTHPAVLQYCVEEVLAKNNFHAALEATKGVFDRLRRLVKTDADGAVLAQAALSCRERTPPVAMNPLRTESERAEQTGFMNLLIGIFGMYRNPTAHEAKVVRQAERPITEPELLELFTTLSMIHHTLDHADPTGR